MTVVAFDRRRVGMMEVAAGTGANGACMLVGDAIAWAEAARAGDELAYAIGKLPAWSQTPRRMRELDERGLVFCFQDGTKTPRHYVARRLDKPWTEGFAPRRIARDVAPAGDDKARLLRVLKNAAKAGRPCPYNRDLAIEADLEGSDRASYLLKLLVKAGAIVNEASEWMPGRQITIVANGHKTAVSVGVRR